MKMMFTAEEFETMIHEVIDNYPPIYDTLCIIVYKSLRKYIEELCRSREELRYAGVEEDILHDAMNKIVLRSITDFLKKEELMGEINNDPAGFNAWICTIAFNEVRTYATRVRRRGWVIDIDDPNTPDIPSPSDKYSDELKESLSECFQIVLDSDRSAHIILTWLIYHMMLYMYDIPQHKISGVLAEMCADKTLYRVRDIVIGAIRKTEWLRVAEWQFVKLNDVLDAQYDGSRKLGEVTYREFFMQKGGAATVIDWVNKINKMIRKAFEDETPYC